MVEKSAYWFNFNSMDTVTAKYVIAAKNPNIIYIGALFKFGHCTT